MAVKSNGIAIDFSKIPYHIRLRKEDVGTIAIIVGDSGRVPVVASYLKRSRQIGSNREFLTYSGYVGENKTIVISTGIGGPAAAIVVEELARLGIKTIIRVGTCGSLHKNIGMGTLVIAEASVRLDGTTKQYVMDGYPAAATPELSVDLKNASKSLGKPFASGIVASTDAFYAGEGHGSFSRHEAMSSRTIKNDMKTANVIAFEMETSTLFVLGRLFGISTGAVLSVVDVITESEKNKFNLKAGINDAIIVAIGAIKEYSKNKPIDIKPLI